MRKVMTLLGVAALVLGAQASYEARFTVSSGNTFAVRKIDIRGDRIYAAGGTFSTSTNAVERVEFRFRAVSQKLCGQYFRAGDYAGLEGLLDEHVAPVAKYSYLPGNLGDYLVWLLRVQYWNGNLKGAGETVGHLLRTGSAAHVAAGKLYRSLLLMGDGKYAEAETLFAAIQHPENVSRAMSNYIRGRLAFEQGNYRQAIRYASSVVALYSRDPEWMAPATVLEAQIYQATGLHAKARTVAQELILAYPQTHWCEVGKEIEKTSTGK